MSEMTAGTAAFVELLEQIADNKYVLGDRLVEVGIGGPNLEATLAAIAMAQGELGHARLLYNWALDLKGFKGKKPEIESQTGKAFPGVVAISNFVELITAVYAVNTALELVLRGLLEKGHSDVVHRIHKLVKEQKDHISYARGWVEQLLDDEGAIPRKCREGLERVLPEAESWLAAVEANASLVEEGYLPAGIKLVEPFRAQVAADTAQRKAAYVN